MNAEDLIRIIGWIGVVGLLAAYFLLTIGTIKSKSYLFNIMNLISSILLVITAIYSNAYPFIAINSFWCIISIIGIVQVAKSGMEPKVD